MPNNFNEIYIRLLNLSAHKWFLSPGLNWRQVLSLIIICLFSLSFKTNIVIMHCFDELIYSFIRRDWQRKCVNELMRRLLFYITPQCHLIHIVSKSITKHLLFNALTQFVRSRKKPNNTNFFVTYCCDDEVTVMLNYVRNILFCYFYFL